MNNGKILVTAVAAGMLAVPASHAAIDDAGMQYTSAAEGFYGSLRMDFSTSDSSTPGAADTDSTGLDVSASRLGVSGTVDLGGGLSASYNYEFAVKGNNGDAIGTTRLHNVGLSGGFGSLLVGTQWALDYNYVWVKTDVMNVRSGWFAYNANRAGRQSNAITYTSPDFNGFNFGLGAVLSSGSLSDLSVTSSRVEVDGTPDPSDDDETAALAALEAMRPDNSLASEEAAAVDKVIIASSYSFRGFNIAGTYVRQDILDINPTSVGLALGYGQDNWSLGYYYAKTDMDTPANNEELVHSFAGQVGIGKTTLRALYETLSDEGNGVQDIDTDFWTLEAQYNLGSKSRVYAEYNQEERDNPNDPSGSSDETLKSIDKSVFLVGYRVDF
jgi:predicted porin